MFLRLLRTFLVRRSVATTATTTTPTQFDIRSSFYGRSTFDILRGLALLRLATFKPFVTNSEKLYKVGQRIFGSRICEKVLEKSFYAQFVAGDGAESLARASNRLLKYGNVKTMICPPMEDLEGVNKDFEAMSKENTDKFLQQLRIADELNQTQKPRQRAVVQYKLSASFSVECMDKVSSTIDKRGEGLARAVRAIIEAFTSNNDESLVQICSDRETTRAFRDGLKNAKIIFQTAKNYNIPITIDAELRSSHAALYALTVAMAAIYNPKCAKDPLVYGTYQCYFKDAPQKIQESLNLCEELDSIFAVKLVRGAYIVQERSIARQTGSPDPIWASHKETSNCYDQMVEMVLRRVIDNGRRGGVSLFVASHNVDSVRKATTAMDVLGIPKDHASVKFAQIYGMCDHISFGLGCSGYTVYKSIPWGAVGELVPYMARRTVENYTAFQTARNEIPLYRAELKTRLLRK